MALTKEKKTEVLETLKEKIAEQKAMIFVDFKGLKVDDLLELRKKLRKTGTEFMVAKKTLMRLALKEKKVDFDPEELEGQIALIFGFEDDLASTKAVYNFSKDNENLKILGGFIKSQDKDFLDAQAVITLGQLPSREELLAKLTGSISSPLFNLVNVLEGNIKGLVYALSAIKK